jgi:ribosomal protein L14E/L6E/L27E
MERGTVVVSLAGHDKGKSYVVVGMCEEYALLCDGKNKTLEVPKKKKKKHLADTGKFIDLSVYSPLYDAHIKKELMQLRRS